MSYFWPIPELLHREYQDSLLCLFSKEYAYGTPLGHFGSLPSGTESRPDPSTWPLEYGARQMEAYYVPKNPIIGAFYMAHFNKDNEPHFIERDSIVPPLSLQRLIFPWIESTFDNDMPDKTESWIQECDQAMLGDDPSEPKTSDVYWDPIMESDVNKDQSTKLASTAMVDRIGFLKLLVRTRRVILQDAVLYLRQDALGRTLSNTLFTSKQEVRDIFESATFRSFQDDLLRKMQLYRTEPQLLNPSFQLSSHQFIEALNRSHRLAMRQNEKSQRSSDSMMDKLDQALQLLEKILTQDAERRRLDEARAIEYVNTAHRHQSELLERQRLDQIHSILGQPHFLSPQQLQQSVQHERERERDRERDQLSLQQPHDQQSLQLQQTHPLQTQTQARPRPRDQPSSDISHQEQERDLSSKGYIMMRDDGKLTVQKAWDEFHGPIADAKSADKNWPYVESGRRAFRRRRQFVRLVEEIAAEKQQDIKVFVEFLTEDAKSRGLSVNQLFTEMRKTKDAKEKEGEVETTGPES
ncbi:hypothetical protein BGZ67_000179 [Mortierella alpina]|nr:hypothetical protein BGZ67_000179 [Mortierella alpina]